MRGAPRSHRLCHRPCLKASRGCWAAQRPSAVDHSYKHRRYKHGSGPLRELTRCPSNKMSDLAPVFGQKLMQSGLVAGPGNKSRSASADAPWPCCAGSRANQNSGSVLRRGDMQHGETRGESGRASLPRSKSAPDVAARRFSRPDGYLVHLAEAAGRERSHPNSPAKCGYARLSVDSCRLPPQPFVPLVWLNVQLETWNFVDLFLLFSKI